jgi:hypothetical protein
MPPTEVVLFAEDDGTVPFIEWLDRQERKVQDKCMVKIDRLQELGYELRRPEGDFYGMEFMNFECGTGASITGCFTFFTKDMPS